MQTAIPTAHLKIDWGTEAPDIAGQSAVFKTKTRLKDNKKSATHIRLLYMFAPCILCIDWDDNRCWPNDMEMLSALSAGC